MLFLLRGESVRRSRAHVSSLSLSSPARYGCVSRSGLSIHLDQMGEKNDQRMLLSTLNAIIALTLSGWVTSRESFEYKSDLIEPFLFPDVCLAAENGRRV